MSIEKREGQILSRRGSISGLRYPKKQEAQQECATGHLLFGLQKIG